MKSKLEQIQNKLDKIKKNHADCIPVFFMKHPQSTSAIKQPKQPFILFKKDFKIQQAMYCLYNQIQIKGLYFYCPYLTVKNKNKNKQQKQELKYFYLQTGPTINQIYKKYGRGGYLTIVYGDNSPDMGGFGTLEKWMIRILIFIAIIWLIIFGLQYYVGMKQQNDDESVL